MKTLFALSVLIGALLAVKLGLDIESQIHFIVARKSGSYIFDGTSGFSTSTASAKKSEPKLIESKVVPAPPDGPPSEFQAGPWIYRIVYVAHGYLQSQSALAQSSTDDHWIALDRIRNRNEVRGDVMHELMHIALELGGGRKTRSFTDPDDDFITPAADQLRDILTDNPALRKWLFAPVSN